jgi:hypothetical protein
MEVETAVRKFLLSQSSVTGYVGQRVFKFQLTEPVHATGNRAVVIRRVGQWTPPDPVKTSEYPIVQVECWADPDRDGDGNVLVSNALDKAFAVQRVIDPLLHGRRGVKFSDLDVVSVQRWSEPIMVTQDDTHGSGRLGDSAYVLTRYAMHVVH